MPGLYTAQKFSVILCATAKKTVWRSAFLLIWHSYYSAILSKKHTYRLLFRRFCPLTGL